MLDLYLILRRRAELGLSRRRVRQLCGWNANRWAGLEDRTNHELITIADLQRLAKALAVRPGQLLASPCASEPQPLDVAIEALLFRAGKRVPIGVLADACDETPARVREGIQHLRDRLHGTGIAVAVTSTGAELVPAAGAASDDQIAKLARQTLPETGIHVEGAEMLRRVAAGELIGGGDRSDHERRWLSYLVRLGYVRVADGGFELAPDVAESLGGAGCPAA